MSPDDQPDELKGLTFMEQVLISPIKPSITLFRLRGGQYGFSGNVISFEQNLSNLVTQLPHTLDSLSEFVIIRRPTDNVTAFREFRVRKQIVNRALQCLIRINSRFRNKITINNDALQQLPDDESVANHLRQIFDPKDSTSNHPADPNALADPANPNAPNNNELIDLLDHSNAPNIFIQSERDRVNRALNIDQSTPEIQQPELNQEPVNELTEGLVALAFPCLFPTGKRIYLVINSFEFKTFKRLKD